MTETVDTHPWARPSRVDGDRVMETLPVAVLIIDQAGCVRFVNAAGAELLAGANGILGRRIEDLMGRESPLTRLVARSQDRQEKTVESNVALPAAMRTGALVTAAAAPTGEAGLTALVLTPIGRMRSLTSPPEAARALVHEVRNPLAGIRAAAQLIGRTPDPEVATLATLICEEVDRIRRLTDRIDPFSAFEHAPFTRVNVHEALDRVRRIIASGDPDITIQEQFDPSLPHIRGDLDQLIQAFLNIAKNAAEALAGVRGPIILLTTAFRPGLRVRRSAHVRPRPQLEVGIIDNGPGLAANMADRLFEPFATNKPGGMGLGLAIASDVIARHDGVIEVDSSPGRTAFRILLPLPSAEERP